MQKKMTLGSVELPTFCEFKSENCVKQTIYR